MESLTFDILCAILFSSGLFLGFAFAEWIFDKAYEHIPFVTRWWDNYCESMAEFDEEDDEVCYEEEESNE